MRTTLLGIAIAALLVGSASAQQATSGSADTTWQPWIGCWELEGESVGDDSDVSAEETAAGRELRRSRRSNGTRVCVAPAAAPGAVTLTTLVGTQKALEEVVIADGNDHPLMDAECRGTKRSEWSTLGYRLFTRATITCEDQTPRHVSSVTMMTGGPTWVDIQLIDVAGRKSIRVRRYQRAGAEASAAQPPTARRSVPFIGETSWTIQDVKEASAKLSAETVQAAIVELRQGFDLNGKRLIELDDAGVPDSVIDLMVALSFPKRFVVEHPVSTSAYYGGGLYGGYGGLMGMWPFIADSYFWPSYYSPFAYRYWGYYDPFYVPYSGYVPVSNAPPGGNTPVASGRGRVVDGLGYTRIREREPEPSIRGNNFGGSNSGFSAGSGSSSGSSGGSSGVTSGGYSSGGGGGDGGRTAVPRPPGGN